MSKVGYINDRVAFHDYIGMPQKGTVVYQKPHRREEGIYWLGILLDNPELNTLEITTENGPIKVGGYKRSDEVSPLID